MTIANEVGRRRTFAIISHPDAGKTTLTEKLLLFAGAIHIAGSVKARKASRHATSDWMEIEKQRGISVASSVMQMEYRDCVINLLDTPGHRDFSEDTYRVLTAVDAALMVIDAGNGVEPQTLRLLQVCRARKTPIITFINKMDREVREPMDLVDEIERVLEMPVVPCSWPVGMGKQFHGVIDVRSNRMRVFRPGDDRVTGDDEIIQNLDDPEIAQRFGDRYSHALQESRLVCGVSPEFDAELFLAGGQTPLFFGSAINNFGVREVLDALVDFAPPPRSRAAIQRVVEPDEAKFSGVVFKIQANMDPAHRDRIAFVRVCSGKFVRGMRLKNCRTGKDLRPNSVVSFLSQRRDLLEEAYPGDIIGIPNHGVLQLGDTLPKAKTCSSPVCRSSRRNSSRAWRSRIPCAANSCARGSPSSVKKAPSRCSGRTRAALCFSERPAACNSTSSPTGCGMSTAPKRASLPHATPPRAGSPRTIRRK